MVSDVFGTPPRPTGRPLALPPSGPRFESGSRFQSTGSWQLPVTHRPQEGDAVGTHRPQEGGCGVTHRPRKGAVGTHRPDEGAVGDGGRVRASRGRNRGAPYLSR